MQFYSQSQTDMSISSFVCFLLELVVNRHYSTVHCAISIYLWDFLFLKSQLFPSVISFLHSILICQKIAIYEELCSFYSWRIFQTSNRSKTKTRICPRLDWQSVLIIIKLISKMRAMHFHFNFYHLFLFLMLFNTQDGRGEREKQLINKLKRKKSSSSSRKHKSHDRLGCVYTIYFSHMCVPNQSSNMNNSFRHGLFLDKKKTK